MTADIADVNLVDYASQKRRIVMMLIAYSAVVGVVACFLPDGDTTLDFVVGLPLLILGIQWCFIDARELGYRIGRPTKVILVLLFMVGFPIYVFQTRGFRGVKTLFFALLVVGLMFAIVFATEYATLCVGDALGVWEMVG